MMRDKKNCFYCQNLGGIPTKWGLCSFCGKKSRPVMAPLYEVYETGKMNQFCCQCAWLRLPHSLKEKAAESKWYHQWKKGLEKELVERHQQRVRKFYSVIRCGDEIVGAIDCNNCNYATK